jgi:hypothetical protein
MVQERKKKGERNKEGTEGNRRKNGVKKEKEKWCGVVGPKKDQYSLVPREGFPLIIQGSNKCSKICSGRNISPCCQDGAQSLSICVQCIPCIQVSWPGYWHHETGCSDPS